MAVVAARAIYANPRGSSTGSISDTAQNGMKLAR
jgi:hypothetical protein